MRLQTSVRSLVFTAVLTLIASASAGAISAGGIGGRPANPDPEKPRTQSIFIFQIDRGESASDSILVVNASGETQTIRLYAVDGQVTNTGSYTCRQEKDARVGLGSWIELGKNQVTLKSNENVEVPFTLTMPKNADVGEHNGCIVFENKSDADVQTSGNIRVKTRQAIRVVATVPGDLQRDVTIESLKLSDKSSQLQYQLALHNTGNVSADVDAKVTLRGIFGQKYYANGGGYPVLANQTLNLTFAQKERPFFGGWYTMQATAQYGAKAGTFGVDEDQELVSKQTDKKWVFIAPTVAGLFVMLLTAIVVVGALAYWLRRRKLQKDIVENGRTHSVKQGETVQSIATGYGISWKKLVAINHIKAPYVIESGQTLHVPKKPAKRK